jgi:hypothetical protein
MKQKPSSKRSASFSRHRKSSANLAGKILKGILLVDHVLTIHARDRLDDVDEKLRRLEAYLTDLFRKKIR